MWVTIKLVLEYWWECFKSSFGKAWEDLGLLGTLIALVVSVLVRMRTENITDIQDFDFEDVTVTVWWLLGFWIAYASLQLLVQIPRKFKLQDDQISSLKKALNPSPRIRIDSWTPVPIPGIWSHTGIVIINERQYELREVEVFIMRLVDLATNEELLRSPEQIRWSAINKPIDGSKRIGGKKPLFVDVFACGRTNEGEQLMVLCSQRGNMYGIEGKASLRFELEISGDFKDVGFVKRFRGIVDYDGDAEIRISKENGLDLQESKN